MAVGADGSLSGGGLHRLRALLRAEPRPVPAARAWRTGLRTAHLLAVACLYGGHVHGVAAPRLVPALLATAATGAALVALELYRAPVWLVQVRGVATLAKLALLLAIPFAWDARVVLLTAVFAIGVVVSHMPGRWRAWSLLHAAELGTGARG